MPRAFENGALPPRPDGTGGILGYPVASAMRQKRSFADQRELLISTQSRSPIYGRCAPNADIAFT
jgi:hypothetical protein